MANEIQYPLKAGYSLYFELRNAAGQLDTGTAFEALNLAHWSQYAQALTDDGTGLYFGSIRSDLPAGRYTLVIRLRAGGSPAASDSILDVLALEWTGAAVASLSAVQASLATVAGYTDTLEASAATIAGYTDTLETAVAAVQSAVNTVSGFVDTEVGAIKTVTDKINTMLEQSGSNYRLTVAALANAPTASSTVLEVVTATGAGGPEVTAAGSGG